jgi:hypothetical protein
MLGDESEAPMAITKLKSKSTSSAVADRMVRPSDSPYPLKGAGSMKGLLHLREDIDLTKPIYQQVFDGNGRIRPIRKTKKAA